MAARKNGATPSQSPRKRTAQQVAQEAFESSVAEGDTASNRATESTRSAIHRME
jgi:hypothetical protein